MIFNFFKKRKLARLAEGTLDEDILTLMRFNEADKKNVISQIDFALNQLVKSKCDDITLRNFTLFGTSLRQNAIQRGVGNSTDFEWLAGALLEEICFLTMYGNEVQKSKAENVVVALLKVD